MGSVRIQAKLLTLILLALGAGSIAYQALVQKVPLRSGETDAVWAIDAQIGFDARPDQPIKARMFVPLQDNGFTTLNESFISNNYGVNVNSDGQNRQVTWSARRDEGKVNLFYRLLLTPRFAQPPKQPEQGEQFRFSPQLEGAEATAATALIEPVRKHSADIETFVSETIKRLHSSDSDNAKLFLQGDTSPENYARAVSLLLGVANIPTELVYTIQLQESKQQQPELWLRTFDGKQWLYFNPDSGSQGLPDDRLIWWTGDEPLLQVTGGAKPQVTLSVNRNEMAALQLSQSLSDQGHASFISSSFYEVPTAAQHLLKVILMIPVGVLLVLLIRSLIGLETLGTFTPVLIALAFRETQLVWGIVLFTVITSIGLVARSYLEYLKLQFMARLAVVLTLVVIMMSLLTLLSFKLGFSTGLSVALFPMVILSMCIERVSIVWEERGGPDAVKISLATLLTASLCYYAIIWPPLVYLVFTFPGCLLILAAIMVLLGHYRGYRLLELARYRALVEGEL